MKHHPYHFRRVFHMLLLPLVFALIGVPLSHSAVPVQAADPTQVLAQACGNTFTATADATLNQGRNVSNFGTAAQLQLGTITTGELRTLLLFDLAALPDGATIQSAELELTPLDGSNNPVAVEIRGLNAAWNETTVTWDTQPALGTRYGTQTVQTSSAPTRIDVTPLVTSWVNGVRNTGLELLPVANGGNASFASRESTALANSAPRLIVRCSLPEVQGGIDPTTADQLQMAGLAKLRTGLLLPASLSLWNGALSSAVLKIHVPSSVAGDGLARAQWFLSEYHDALRLPNPAVQLQLARRTPGKEGGEAFFFRQRLNGIPILGATFSVHMNGEEIQSVGGHYLPDIDAPAQARLTAAQAEAIATALFGDGSVRIGDQARKLGDGSVRPGIVGNTQLRYFNPALLGGSENRSYLTWRVNVTGVEGAGAIYVDAINGAIRFRQPFVMEDLDLDIETGNHDTSISCWILTTSDDQWFDEDGVVSGANPDTDGYNDYNFSKQSYYYWLNRFNHDSYDDDGEDIESYVHVGQNWNNAHYDSGCDIFEFGDGYPVKDVVAHEYAHGVTRNFADLIYQGQSGALNESFSDIFGYFVDDDDWQMGENLPGGPLRDLSNPPAQGQPDTMSNYVVTNSDNGGVHTNSGIHNKAAYLIINGGTHNGFTIQALGKTKAERLFYNMLIYRLWDSAQMIDARNAAIAEATWQFVQGNFSQNNICQVQNAYAAVGLGNGDTDCDGQNNNNDPDNDNDGVLDGPDNCNNIANPGQNDLDGDGIGDACDDDLDGDGDLNTADNCKYTYNPNQADWNSDGQGDVCDDSDQDTVKDNTDNCRSVANADQKNSDGDSQGDACDTDDDNDGKADNIDNCQFTYNPNQQDSDGDGIGDACDKCPGLADPDNGDPDNDGLGNPCDPDDDNDGIPDKDDICQYEAGLGCLDIGGVVDDDFVVGILSRFPIPFCPMCGSEILKPGTEVMITMELPVGYQARVIDSNGHTVAKGKAFTGGQLSLNFKPAAFAGKQVAVQGLAASFMSEPAADSIRYYLDVAPAPGVDPNQTQRFKMTIGEGIPTMVYLPLVIR